MPKLSLGPLDEFRTIVVTGPQRSGTTIAAKMIAYDLQLQYIDEEAFGVHSLDRFWPLLNHDAVIHAPALSAHCHQLPPHVAVTFMFRPVDEIIASQERLVAPDGSTWTDREQQFELAKYFRNSGVIAEVKYEIWELFQRPLMDARQQSYLELHYASLARHPLWEPQERRLVWHARQTTLKAA